MPYLPKKPGRTSLQTVPLLSSNGSGKRVLKLSLVVLVPYLILRLMVMTKTWTETRTSLRMIHWEANAFYFSRAGPMVLTLPK